MRISDNRRIFIAFCAVFFFFCSVSPSFALSAEISARIQEIRDSFGQSGGSPFIQLQSRASEFSFSRIVPEQFTPISHSLPQFNMDAFKEMAQAQHSAVQLPVSVTFQHSSIISNIGGVTTTQMNQLFGASVVKNMPSEVLSELRTVVKDIGYVNAQQAINDLAVVLGNDFIATCNPKLLPGLIRNTAALGAGGLSQGIQVVADALGVSSQDVVSAIGGEDNISGFVECLTAIGVDNVSTALIDMASLFGMDSMKNEWLGDPARMLDVACQIECIGIDTIQSSLSSLQEALSMSPDYVRSMMCNLAMDNNLAYFFPAINEMGKDNFIGQLNSMVSVFGKDAVVNDICSNAVSVLYLAQNINALDCGGMEGFFNRIGKALGVSGAEVAGTFQYGEGWFYVDAINSILWRVTEIGLDTVCDYLSQMSGIYTTTSIFEQIQYSPGILGDVLHAIDNMGGLELVVDGLCKTYSYSDVVYAMQDMGMAALSRFEADDLAGVISNRINNVDDGRPLTVVIYPSADHNGAFTSSRTVFHELIDNGYRVMYYEADTDTEIEVCLVNATQNGAVPAEVLMVGGHGTDQSLALGCGGGEECTVDFSDYSQLSGLSDMVADGATIILVSCSNGAGLSEHANMANMWAQLFPNAAHVFSMTEPSNIDDLTFGRDGSVTGVTFGCDMYDAALYDTNFTFSGMDEEELAVKVDIAYQQLKI